MSRTKEQRIKNLKRNRIWPSILGLFLILFIFATILMAVMAASVADVVQRKLVDSVIMTTKVADLFEDYGPETKESIEQSVLSHIDILDGIDAVAVFDAEKNLVWSSNGEYPSAGGLVNTALLEGITDKETRIITSEDEDQLEIKDKFEDTRQ